jgi:hypothetical protein
MKLSIALLLACSGFASAQSVTMRGKIEDVTGTGQFFLDCTDVDLSSVLLNLKLFVGQQVKIQGGWNGSVAAPAVVVEAIPVVPEMFEIGGGGKICELAHPTVTASPGSLAWTLKN